MMLQITFISVNFYFSLFLSVNGRVLRKMRLTRNQKYYCVINCEQRRARRQHRLLSSSAVLNLQRARRRHSVLLQAVFFKACVVYTTLQNSRINCCLALSVHSCDFLLPLSMNLFKNTVFNIIIHIMKQLFLHNL